MKRKLFVFVALLLAGCAVPYPYYEGGAYQYQPPMPPSVQYAPPPVQYVPVPVYRPMYITPMYPGYYAPYPYDPFLSFRFNFNFGKKHHHHGGGHHRGRR